MRLIDADELLDEICRDQCERKYKDCDGTCEIAAYVVNAPTIGGWISVKDRLPEEKEYVFDSSVIRNSSEFVLVSMYTDSPYKRNFVTIARYDYDKRWPRWVIRSAHKAIVTHWMPLPEPPEEENDDS